QEALEQLLGQGIESLRRTPYEYGTSFALDALEVRAADGSETRMLLKDLGGASEKARSVKPLFLLDPLREIEVYREILAGRGLGAAHWYGGGVGRGGGRYGVSWERCLG